MLLYCFYGIITWLRVTTVYCWSWMSNGQNHLRRPSRNRARLCLLCSQKDWLPMGFRGCEETYFLWNLWLELLPSKCLGKWNVLREVNQLQLAMLIRVTYLLLSIYHILNMWPLGLSRFCHTRHFSISSFTLWRCPGYLRELRVISYA